ncbi:MAG: hypothetical protein IPK53_06025 [bacterium]|nr:hypothetical protein [bacterium]MBK8128511.1 hypothetical protein [bacterium]
MTIKERIGWKLLQWRKHEPPDGRISLPHAAKDARSACIILPANFDDFDVVRTILPELLIRLIDAKTTIWVRENFRSWLIINESCTVINYDPADATRFGLPDAGTLRHARAQEFDLLLDLSLTPDLYVAALVNEARATTKVALAHPNTQSLYNLLVESQSEDRGRRVLALLNYL